MDYKALLEKVNKDFGQSLTIYKEKAGYLMLNPSGTLGNWDCGHSCPSRGSYVELPNGWAYALIDDQWYRLRDGMCGWRQGPEDAFGAALPDAPADYKPFR